MSAKPDEKTIILVRVTVEPHNIPKFLEAFHECFEHCINEPECERFEVFGVTARKGEFCWLETWKGSKDWFMTVQMNRPYYEPYTAITKPMWTTPRTIEFLEHQPTFPPYIQ